MLSYCLKCRKNTCAICGSKKSKFIKKQEASGILSRGGGGVLEYL